MLIKHNGCNAQQHLGKSRANNDAGALLFISHTKKGTGFYGAGQAWRVDHAKKGGFWTLNNACLTMIKGK